MQMAVSLQDSQRCTQGFLLRSQSNCHRFHRMNAFPYTTCPIRLS
jgi:hypothetical protein